MKYSNILYIASVIIVPVVAGAVYYFFRKEKPKCPFDHKHVSLLSYEWILNTVTSIIKTAKIGQDLEVSTKVLPNLLAKDFFSSNDGQTIYKVLKLDDVLLDRVIIIMFSGQNVHINPIAVTYEELSNDFNDFIPKDKIYIKKIKIKNAG